MIKVAPSILAANPLCMGEEVDRMVEAGCDWLHVDIMDGHFVPNMTFGPGLVQALKGRTSIPLDVHLMISHPMAYAAIFLDAGADILTIHAEISDDPLPVLELIRSRGKLAGLSLKPDTPVEKIVHLLPHCDLVLVMTVEPGFGGQAFRPEQVHKLPLLRQAGFQGLLEADGGVALENLSLLGDAGLDVAVMGTALFRAADPGMLVRKAHEYTRG